jgi:hypothetical protein
MRSLVQGRTGLCKRIAQLVTGMSSVMDMWVCIEQVWEGVILGSVDTGSPLFLVIGSNNTHNGIDLMSSMFANLTGTGNFTN